MKYLLDTPVFLWWCLNDARLSAAARAILGNADNAVLLSAASAWEMALKTAAGRLTLPEPPLVFVAARCERHSFQALPVRLDHALQVAELPDHHQDPFDRLLVAQCQLDGLSLISNNPQMRQYDVEIAW